MPSPFSLPFPHDLARFCKAAAACLQPFRGRRCLEGEPEGVGAALSSVLGSMADDVLPEELLRHHPAMYVKGRDTKTDGELVVLIADLLELVMAALPKCGELDFDTSPGNNQVCLRVPA